MFLILVSYQHFMNTIQFLHEICTLVLDKYLHTVFVWLRAQEISKSNPLVIYSLSALGIRLRMSNLGITYAYLVFRESFPLILNSHAKYICCKQCTYIRNLLLL